jgi:hypothetical protein
MPAIGVEQLALGIGAQQRLMGVLAVNIHQPFAQISQLGARGRAAVDEGARTALAHDQPPYHTGVVIVQTLLDQPVARVQA